MFSSKIPLSKKDRENEQFFQGQQFFEYHPFLMGP
jgi:hypothetical protein